MNNISPYGKFTGRRLYSTSKIDNEIEETLHRFSKLEPYLRMPTNPNQSLWMADRTGHSPRAEWLREAKEWERGLVGTEDDRKLKDRILDRILKTEAGKVRAPGHLALVPSWNKIGGRTFKRYFGIDFVGGKHMVVMPDSLRNALTGRLTNATTTSGFQEAINYLASRTAYGCGGVLEVLPGQYTSSSVWALPSSTSYAFDFTMQGGGKSNTDIQITPAGTQTAAIAEGYSSWIHGTVGPRFVMRDLSLDVSGTYTGTSAPGGDSSGGGVVSLQFYSVFFEHVEMSINTPSLTAQTNLLKCGCFAGPSQPCDWNNFEIHGFTGSSNILSVVAVWFEGFHWHGGLIELQDAGCKGGGIAIRSNGPNYLGQIDSYDQGNPTPNNWGAFVSPSGITTLDELEYPFLPNIGTTTGCGSVSGDAGNACITTIGVEEESAAGQGDPTIFGFWNGGCRLFKTIGFSLGLQNGNQWISSYLTGPFNNNIAGVGYLVGTNTYLGVTAPTASTTYRASTDMLVNSNGGTGVNITICDQFGNVILTGLTTLSAFNLKLGMKVNFGAFSVAPSVTVYQVSG